MRIAAELVPGGVDFPPRLVKVAIRVDELLAQPEVADTFERMCPDWKAKLNRFPGGTRIGFLARRRALNMAEKYVRLLAIRDRICEHVKRVDAWRGSRRSRGRFKASVPYGHLKFQVEELQDPNDLEQVEDMLREVEADLASHAAVSSPTGVPAVTAPRVRQTDVREGSPKHKWMPPPRYVGMKTIMTAPRFRKDGKNPPRTTIQAWIEGAANTGQPVDQVKAPDSQEVHVPEDWVREQIKSWHPRT